MEKKLLAYVAGPISKNTLGCVRDVQPVFDALRAASFVPFLPQLSVISEMVQSRPWDEWMSYDLDIISHCDLLIVMPGESEGVKREIEFAVSLKVPVFGWEFIRSSPNGALGELARIRNLLTIKGENDG